MINFHGIKARPADLHLMLAHRPSLVEFHCSARDLLWTPDRDYGLPLAVHVPEYNEQGVLLDPASPDEQKRKIAEDVYVRATMSAVAWAPAFNDRPRVVFHPGGATPADADHDQSRTEARYAALGRTIDAMKAAAGSHVDVLLENLPVSCWFFGGMWKANIVTSGRELSDLGRRYGVGVTLDLCHLYLACAETGRNFMDEVEAAMPAAKHIHYSGAEGTDGEGLQVNDGDLPLMEVFKQYGNGHDIFAVPEIWFGHENGGAEFVEAWRLVEKGLGADNVVAAEHAGTC